MIWARITRKSIGTGFLLLSFAVGTASAKDLRITLPKRSKPTPVQKLNREGVKAIEHHDYEKAKKLFYRAYLLDPNDPFTLNNLGYISELEGKLDRAERFYDLAQQQNSSAVVDLSNDDALEGKAVSTVAGDAQDKGMQVNRMNVRAIQLLLNDRAPEADLLLQKALELDAKNPFTLNNMGYTREKEGELESALRYYRASAATGSSEPVIVTIDKDWRGKPISKIAAENADKLQREMDKEQSVSALIRRLNLQGVSALNRNDPRTAKELFQKAYKLDPNNAFTLNNMGYLAELNGDKETADFYYAKAQEANLRNAKVDVATRQDMEGRKLGEVADIGSMKVQARMKQEQDARRREGGPILLMRRNKTLIQEPETPPAPAQPPVGEATNEPQPRPIPQMESAPAQQNPNAIPDVLPPAPGLQQQKQPPQ